MLRSNPSLASSLALPIALLLFGCGGVPPADPPADCGFAPLAHDPFGETLQLQSADGGGTCVRVERRDDSEPDFIYKAVPYTLLSFTVRHEGQLETIEDQSALSWVSSHHNWADVGTAEGERALYQLESTYREEDGGEWRFHYALTLLALDTRAVLAGPIALEPETLLEP